MCLTSNPRAQAGAGLALFPGVRHEKASRRSQRYGLSRHQPGFCEDARLLLGRQPREFLSRASTPPARRSTPTARSTAASSTSSAAAPRSCRASPRSGTSRADGTVYTFHLRKGVKWHNQRAFKPTRDFNADDMIFTIERQWKEDEPVLQGDELEPFLLQRHGHAEAPEVGREGRRLHGARSRSTSPRRRSSPTSRWNMPASSRRNTPTRCSRPARPRRSTRSRSAPARSISCSTRRTRSSATRRSRNSGAARPRSTTSSSRSRRTRRCAGPSCRRANATSCPIRTRPTSTPSARMPNVQVLEQPGLNIGYLAYNTHQEAVRRRARAQGHQHGDRQEGDHRRRLSLDRRRGEESDPAVDVVVQRRDQGRPVRSGSCQEAAGRSRLSRTASRPTCGRCRCSVPTTPTPSASPN